MSQQVTSVDFVSMSWLQSVINHAHCWFYLIENNLVWLFFFKMNNWHDDLKKQPSPYFG